MPLEEMATNVVLHEYMHQGATAAVVKAGCSAYGEEAMALAYCVTHLSYAREQRSKNQPEEVAYHLSHVRRLCAEVAHLLGVK